MIKFRLLKPDEIECRVGNVTSKGYTLLLYKNARADMGILDEVVGAENWSRDHYECKGNLFCKVGININYKDSLKEPYFVWKSDCGTESDYEKEKGESSDSFKRACTNWGIGRELYTSPFIFISCETIMKEYNGKKCYYLTSEEQNRKFKVTQIDYLASKISKIVINDAKTGKVIFNFYANTCEKKELKPITKLEEVEVCSEEKENVCYNCGEKITDKVAKYSKDKFGYMLCYDCQKLPKEEIEEKLPF